MNQPISQIPAIDIHVHYNSGSPYDHPGANELFRCTPDFVKLEYDCTNIAIGCFSSYASVTHVEPVYEENSTTQKLAAENPWFYYWVVINPYDKSTYTQADAMLRDDKCLGIKIHPYFHEFTIEDQGDAIFSFAAERGATVLLHPASLPTVTEMANKYRDCRIMVAHLSSLEHIDCIRNAVHGNVLTDTSGSGIFDNNVAEYAVSQLGADRILFGTDTYSAAAQRGRIELSRLSEEAKRDILYRNALRLFPKLRAAYPDTDKID